MGPQWYIIYIIRNFREFPNLTLITCRGRGDPSFKKILLQIDKDNQNNQFEFRQFSTDILHYKNIGLIGLTIFLLYKY